MSNNSLFGTGNQIIGKPIHMDELPKIIGRNVARYREQADMSRPQLAKAIGVKSTNTIAAIELGQTKLSKYLPKIASVLKVSLADIDPTAERDESVIVPAMPGSEPIDVYASVEAGSGALVVSNEPYRQSNRPQSLTGIRDGYGVLVVGDSMIPVIKPGYTVWINPHLPPRAGEICLFIHDDHGEFRATIKEYCGQNTDQWFVKRYQPKERKYSLPKREWPKCHVVVGVDFGR